MSITLTRAEAHMMADALACYHAQVTRAAAAADTTLQSCARRTTRSIEDLLAKIAEESARTEPPPDDRD